MLFHGGIRPINNEGENGFVGSAELIMMMTMTTMMMMKTMMTMTMEGKSKSS